MSAFLFKLEMIRLFIDNFRAMDEEKTRLEGLNEATKRFLDFVDTTYRSLVLKEEMEVGRGCSDLRVFCRLDVVVMEEESGGLNFVVDGVRGIWAGLFLQQSPVKEITAFSKDIAIALRTWLAIRLSLKAEQRGV